MNFGVIVYILGWILKAEAAFMLLPFGVGMIYRERSAFSFLMTALLCFAVGLVISWRKPKQGGLYLKEGYFVVALGWLLMSLFGCFPFMLSGEIPHFWDALFETVSGLSTTGASVLADVESLSRACLFWRSFTHFLGGMGVFVFLSALLPMLGGNSLNLMKAESTGPSVDKLVPRLRDTAFILYAIYIAMFVIESVILLILGLDLFDSVTLSFGTVGTGGFGLLNTSCMTYSPAVQWTIAIFMMLSGANYSFYFFIISRRLREAFGMEEIRLYFGCIVIAVAIICLNLRDVYGTFGETLRHSFFQVSSLVTSTGFITADFDLWPELSKAVLILVMFMGACAGSTGGGIKMSRILILVKSIRKQIDMLIHPRAVKKIRIDGATVDHEAVRATNAYIAVFVLIFATSALLLSVDGHDFTTNFTAVLATLNNMGPGFNLVGPTCNYSFFSDFSKLVLIFDMLAGRLELFPMLLIITPRSWRRRL